MHRFAILVFGSALLIAAASAAADDNPGKAVFLAQKCNLCHSVEAAGIEAKTTSEKLKGPDLTLVTTRHEAEWIGKFVRRQIQKDGADHKKEFKGTDEELQALVGWFKALEQAHKQ